MSVKRGRTARVLLEDTFRVIPPTRGNEGNVAYAFTSYHPHSAPVVDDEGV